MALLEARDINFQTVRYLDQPPSVDQLKRIIAMLGVSVRDVMRRTESIYKALALDEAEDENVLLAAMTNHPILIERPIVVSDMQARIGRPPEAVLEILP